MNKKVVGISALTLGAAVAAYNVADLPADVSVQYLFKSIIEAVTSFKSVEWQVSASAFVFTLIASCRNSILSKYIWDKLGVYKGLAAPFMGIILALLSMQQFSLQALIVGVTTGAGAIAMNELLSAIKLLPGVGSKVVFIIDVIGRMLKNPTPMAATKALARKKQELLNAKTSV